MSVEITIREVLLVTLLSQLTGSARARLNIAAVDVLLGVQTSDGLSGVTFARLNGEPSANNTSR